MSSWSIDFLREHGVEPYQDRDFSKQRVGRVEQIASVISSQKVEDFYDAIVLDEAQDYTEAEMVLFFKLAKVVFAAADSRQQIYQTGGAATHNLEAMFTGNVFRLKHHYRNGHAICRLADALAASWKGFDEMMPTSNYDEVKYPSSVNVHRCVDLSAQLDKALDSVQRQAKAYPNELLGLLAPRAALASISALIKASPLASNVILQTADEGYVPFSQSKHTCLCSVHGAKGLEFRTVHLLDAEAVGKGASLRRKITYTAVTRAKTSLAIYHTEVAPRVL
jgi:superfamily I DNA/RNA helicase